MVCNVLIDGRKINDFGVGTHLKAFLQNIGKNVFENFNFKIIFKKQNNLYPFKSYTFPFGEYNPISILFFGTFTRKIKHNLIYTPFFNYSPFSKNTIITVHDIIPIKFPEIYRKKFGYFFYKKYFKYSIKKAKKIFVVSKTTENDLIEYFPHLKSKIIKIPNSTHPLFYKNYNFKKEDYFCFIGNNKEHKNLKLLLNVWEDFSKKYPKYYLYIISPVNISLKNIRVFKNLKTEELIEILGKARALISPSIYEGFNLPLLEAILLQTPPLASKIASNIEQLGLDYPFYFEPNDNNFLYAQMEKIIKENEICQEILKNIKEKNENVPENLTEKILENLNP